MKSKIFFIISSLLLFSVCLSAQSFFKAVPKKETSGLQLSSGATAPAATTMTAWRPVTNILAYAEPQHILMAGAGVAYEKLQWDDTAQKWKVSWSIATMAWGGASVDGTTKTDAVSYGVLFGLANNLIMFGPALNNGKLIGVVSIGINLNN